MYLMDPDTVDNIWYKYDVPVMKVPTGPNDMSLFDAIKTNILGLIGHVCVNLDMIHKMISRTHCTQKRRKWSIYRSKIGQNSSVAVHRAREPLFKFNGEYDQCCGARRCSPNWMPEY